VPRVPAVSGSVDAAAPADAGARRSATLQSSRQASAIAHDNTAFAPPKLPNFAHGLTEWTDRVDLHDVIWLIIISTGLIMLWGSSDHWSLAGLWRRVGHALHLDHRAHGADHQR
jgi:hypothetical protein